MAGRLLVVGTPIGNLGDLSPRASEALRAADLVAAEDTRVAARLLAHLGARVPTRSFNAHNASRRVPELLSRLAAGGRVVLTTDAGMPGVSDPGALLVTAAREAGHAVEVVPGATAVTAAVAAAGVEATGFVFGGFLPARPASTRHAALVRFLAAAGDLGLPLVLYEAPHRVRSLLDALTSTVPDATVAVCRELTKRHEQVLVGPSSEVAARVDQERGEFTLVVWGVHGPGADTAEASLDGPRLAAVAAGQGLGQRSIAELLRAAGIPRRRAYELAAAALEPPRAAQ